MLGRRKEICGPQRALGSISDLDRDILVSTVSRNSLDDQQGRCRLVPSAAALRHAGPVRAAAREASFADTAEGAAGVHTPLALAQQPPLVQLSALIDVCKVG